MRKRHIAEEFVKLTYADPDGREPASVPGREIRWRNYDWQRIEIVVDLSDGSVVSVWITQVPG